VVGTEFSDLGLFVVEGHFDRDYCRALRTEVGSASEMARIARKGRELVDEEVRRTRTAAVRETTSQEVRARLLELRPGLERHFDLKLRGCESPCFLRYGAGDFFAAHQDGNADPETTEYLNMRKISVVLVLNRQREEDETEARTYAGGSLVFYGLIDEPGWESVGFPCPGREGLLVAFPSYLTHEVEPVTAGDRYTVVTWFY